MIERAARQLPAYGQFLRWAGSLGADGLDSHPAHSAIKLLSPVVSGRFTFAVDGGVLYLGVQPFEAVWVELMPWSRAMVADRLYLCVDPIDCLDVRLPALVLGIFVDMEAKRTLMRESSMLQFTAVCVSGGRVTAVGEALGDAVPLIAGGLDEYLAHLGLPAPIEQVDQ
jgi:hypothetical protein